MLERILCVDDDPITLMLCRKVISKATFAKHTDSAANGEEALHYFDNLILHNEENYPELIFLDLNMPVMGGWEFLDNFSKTYANFLTATKVIVLSSTIDPADVDKAKTYPMVIDFLSKPITVDMLEELKEVLQK
ncbi:MAG: response regulator [Flavobacterium sp.]|nr:MAG: response regulator [Flavobacterium sp.]